MNLGVWGHRRKVSALCLLYKIYHRVDHPMNDCLNHVDAARNTRASAALEELALVVSRCRTDHISRSVVSACCCASVVISIYCVFSGDTKLF